MLLHALTYSQYCLSIEHAGCMHIAVQVCCLVYGLPGLQLFAPRYRMRSVLSCRLYSVSFPVLDRCLLGEADGALYMAFMGTKQRRDLVTNAQVLQEPIWPEDLTSEPQEASQVLETGTLALLVLRPSKPWGCAIDILCSPNSCT